MVKYKMPEPCSCSTFTRYKRDVAITTGVAANNLNPKYTAMKFRVPFTSAISLTNFLPTITKEFKLYPGTLISGGTPTSGSGHTFFPIAGPFSRGLTVHFGGIP